MSFSVRRFLTDPFYPSPDERKRIRKAFLSAILVFAAVSIVAFYTVGPIVVLLGSVLAMRQLVPHVPITVQSPHDATLRIMYADLAVSWRWVYISLVMPLFIYAARGRVLWARLVSCSCATFIVAAVYFEAVKTNEWLATLNGQWGDKVAPVYAARLHTMLFWRMAWETGLQALGLSLLINMAAALVTRPTE